MFLLVYEFFASFLPLAESGKINLSLLSEDPRHIQTHTKVKSTMRKKIFINRKARQPWHLISILIKFCNLKNIFHQNKNKAKGKRERKMLTMLNHNQRESTYSPCRWKSFCSLPLCFPLFYANKNFKRNGQRRETGPTICVHLEMFLK